MLKVVHGWGDMEVTRAVAGYEVEDPFEHSGTREIPHLMPLQVYVRSHSQSPRGHGPRQGSMWPAANLIEIKALDKNSAGTGTSEPRKCSRENVQWDRIRVHPKGRQHSVQF